MISIVNISVTYPLNKVIIRQMIHGVRVHKAILQLHNEGLYYLYRGILPPLCQKTLSMSIMFGMYGECHKTLSTYAINPYIVKAMSGMIAGTMEAILMPFERIQTLLSVTQYHGELRNMSHAFKELRHYGLGEYYRGLLPILLRNGPSNACFFIIRDEVQNYLPKQRNSAIERTLTQFATGAFIGVTLSTVFYPLNVVKFRMQQQLGGQYQSILSVFMLIYRERGSKLRNIYKGVSTNSTRAFFSWGVINAAYENLKKLLC
ncbi:uncharacterized protein CBL_06068 [Carabus blaptoides fortunei]